MSKFNKVLVVSLCLGAMLAVGCGDKRGEALKECGKANRGARKTVCEMGVSSAQEIADYTKTSNGIVTVDGKSVVVLDKDLIDQVEINAKAECTRKADDHSVARWLSNQEKDDLCKEGVANYKKAWIKAGSCFESGGRMQCQLQDQSAVEEKHKESHEPMGGPGRV